MATVTLDSPLPYPQAVVAPRLLTVLSGYAERDDVALSLNLGPAGAEISVPVSLELAEIRRAELDVRRR